MKFYSTSIIPNLQIILLFLYDILTFVDNAYQLCTMDKFHYLIPTFCVKVIFK